MRKLWVIVIGFIILGLVNYSIYSREQLITSGQTVLLELAPVDPRSLMQGDYVTLRFSVAAQARRALNKIQQGDETEAADGYIVLSLDEKGVGRFNRLDDLSALKTNEIRMLYRKRGHKMKFATNAFFFQEGLGKLYETAQYGEFKVAENGDSILVALWNADLDKIEP